MEEGFADSFSRQQKKEKKFATYFGGYYIYTSRRYPVVAVTTESLDHGLIYIPYEVMVFD